MILGPFLFLCFLFAGGSHANNLMQRQSEGTSRSQDWCTGPGSIPPQGQEYTLEGEEYDYKLILGESITQKQKTGTKSWLIGNYASGTHDTETYDNGDGCRNGIKRRATITFMKGDTTMVLKEEELSPCNYEFEFQIECKDASETCEDGIQNQDEIDIDCGGACSACAAETCEDGIQNFDETDIDCGGACSACDSSCDLHHKVVREQTTKCSSSIVQGNVFICHNPIISYGNVNGGIPSVHSKNDYDKWCEEMGFERQSGSIQTQTEKTSTPQGWLFGCSSYDSTSWHWCDFTDGYWYNQRLDDQGSRDRITQVKCERKNNNAPACYASASKCKQCIYEFVVNGGFDCIQNESCDVTALIPEGCIACNDAMLLECDAECVDLTGQWRCKGIGLRTLTQNGCTGNFWDGSSYTVSGYDFKMATTYGPVSGEINQQGTAIKLSLPDELINGVLVPKEPMECEKQL